MKSKFVNQTIKYDGSQLRPLWAYENYQILGPSVISWCGPCEVTTQHMVDLEDLVAGSKIEGHSMLHFIIEFFDHSLVTAVFFQRLVIAKIKDELLLNSKNKKFSQTLIQEGDDLYFLKNNKKAKLSISIAGKSAVSLMIHIALNITNEGTPVFTGSLQDLNIDPVKFSKNVMKNICIEFQDVIAASQKARPL